MNISIPSLEGSGSPDIDFYDSVHLAESLGTYTFASSPTQCEAPITPSTDWPLTPQTPSCKTFETPGHENYSQYMSSDYDHFVTAPTADFQVLESPTAAIDSEANASGIMSSPMCGSIPPSPMIEQRMFYYNYILCYNMDLLYSYSSVVAHAAASGPSRGLNCVAEPPMELEEW
ncbi:BQ5605_C018g08686 [Microbotryum silenes-dioicae]|uniref:BQ5605_C018g08686 protein n=1 Tax=Microbotryum silenes-dioicae TaxID=796604 RepID=A0A2X0P0F5_9BASI|nr:BQ5605_C018g08686 [Microbotryum silenes-dioicae]